MSEIKTQLFRNGYAVVNGFLKPDTLRELREISAHILTGLPAAHRDQFRSTGSLCNFGDHAEFAEIVADGNVAGVITQLGFTGFKWLAGYLISKPGHSPSLFWHQDWWGWSEDISYLPEPLGLGFMYYLTDTTPGNGCLRVIPGSHRHWHDLHGLPQAHSDALGRAQDIHNIAYQSHPDEVAVTVKAGDLVVMDSRVLHSAYANTTSDERSLLTIWYLPNFEEMPEAIRDQFAKIFDRSDLDIDAGAERPRSPLDWPAKPRELVSHLFPHGAGTAPKISWDRSPQRHRMNP